MGIIRSLEARVARLEKLLGLPRGSAPIRAKLAELKRRLKALERKR